ncbi:MAG: HDOD domain-containing protein [Kofleriaceae bacterium]
MASLEHLERALSARLEAGRLKIPPYPAVAAKLAELSKKSVSLTELVKVVSADAALAAQVLGRAQSAAHSAGGKQVTTLFEALTRIGMEQLVDMAFASGLGSTIIASGPLAELRRDMWRRCLLSAQLARMLADNRGVVAETAYSAGLVHDLGAAIVITALEEVAKTMPLPSLPEATWRDLVRQHQVKFGLVIAARWNLPPALTDVIAHAHDEASDNPLVKLIELSDRIVAKLDDMPTVGLAAMMDFEELSEIERCSIGSAVQEVVKNMASYTAPVKPVFPSVVVERGSTEQAFPVSFELCQDQQKACRARAISADALVFEGPCALSPNWLVELSLRCGPAPLTILANVRSCDKAGGVYAIVAQPFALGAETKAAWMNLVDDARRKVSAESAVSGSQGAVSGGGFGGGLGGHPERRL